MKPVFICEPDRMLYLPGLLHHTGDLRTQYYCVHSKCLPHIHQSLWKGLLNLQERISLSPKKAKLSTSHAVQIQAIVYIQQGVGSVLVSRGQPLELLYGNC